jgi:HK97 family phage prohead protease
MNAPEQRTVAVDVEDLATQGRTLRGFAATYDSESRDLGGYVETIQPGAFRDVLASDPDVYLTFNHSPDKVLARTTSGTLRLRDEERGLAFEADLGDGPTPQDVREMVRRGDVTGCSFRFQVSPGGEQWDGERRTLTRIERLIDLSLATTPAYDGPRVELRSKENTPVNDSTTNATTTATTGATFNITNTAGSLRVEDRASGAHSLTTQFRTRGFPGTVAALGWDEFRTASFAASTTLDPNPVRQVGVSLGFDQRYAWPVFPSVAVDSATTNVQVLRQSSRGLPSPSDVIRGLDSTIPKPEVDSEVELTSLSLNQVAAVETGVPNIILEQPTIQPLIETDLRLALNEGLDKLVLDAVADSDNQDPASDPLLVSIRKCITTIQAAGYAPDTLIITPADSEALDVLQTDGPEAFYVFGAARFAPGQLFGLNVRVSKTIDVPVVCDSSALGRLYVSAITLARFEENSGSTNSSTIRLEGSAAFGVERLDACIRISA